MATKELKDDARRLIEDNMNRAHLAHLNETKAFKGAFESEHVDDDVKITLQATLEQLVHKYRAWRWILNTINAAENSHCSDPKQPDLPSDDDLWCTVCQAPDEECKCSTQSSTQMRPMPT